MSQENFKRVISPDGEICYVSQCNECNEKVVETPEEALERYWMRQDLACNECQTVTI